MSTLDEGGSIQLARSVATREALASDESMWWNYRVVRARREDGTHAFAVHEVYYDQTNGIVGWTAEPVGIAEEKRLADLLETLAHMRHDAQRHPVLEVADEALVEVSS